MTFTEETKTSFGQTSSGQIWVDVTDKNGAAAGITLGGTLVVTAPGYAGVTASVDGANVNRLIIKSSGPWDNGLLESLSVSGITVKITSAVPVGALKATVANAVGDLAIGGWAPSTTITKVTGTLANAYSAGATAVIVNLTSKFDATCGNFVAGGNNLIFTNGATDSVAGVAISAVAGAGATPQTLTVAALGQAHAQGEVVSQTLAASCVVTSALPYSLSSPGSVVAGVKMAAVSAPTVLPGENNQWVGAATLTESPGQKVIGVGTITFKLAGALFSKSPTVDVFGTNSVCSISFDRTSCTVNVGAQSAGGGVVT